MTDDKEVSYMFGDPIDLGSNDAACPVVLPESGEADGAPPSSASRVTPPVPPEQAPNINEEGSSSASERSITLDTPPPGWKRIGRGVYLKTLLQLRLWTDDQLVAAIHAYYQNSRTTAADVKFNASLIGRLVGVKPSTLRVKEEKRELLPPPPWDPMLERFAGTVMSEPDLKVVLEYLNESEMAAGGSVGVAPAAPTAPAVVSKYADEKQPSRFRKSIDPNREFDKTSLRNNSHFRWCHRDAIAHAERWSFAGRYINGNTDVLDVGCGPDIAMIDVLTMPRNQVPKSYCGIDLNKAPQRHPTRQWATLHWEFNFIERYAELGQFDIVINYEMAEHMRAADQPKLLKGLKTCLRPDGLIFLSTPCFNNKSAAANHLHELKIDELAGLIKDAGLRVVDRFGTFANATAIKKVASEEDLRTLERLKPYHSDEMLAVIFACLYPDASRNNLWALKHA